MSNIIIAKNSDGSCDIAYISANATIQYINEEGVLLERPQTIEEHIISAIPEFRALIKTENWMVGDTSHSKELETLQELYDRIGEDALQKIRPFRLATIDVLPIDRTFRKAWTDNNPTQTVDVDMSAARTIQMNNIRKARAIKFETLGFPIKLNNELEDKIISKEIKNKLQALRDLPINTDLSKANTPEELKAIWPKELI